MKSRTKRLICEEAKTTGTPENTLHEHIVYRGELQGIRKGKRFMLAIAKEPYRVGDTVRLIEMRNGKRTGERMDVKITHLLKDSGGLVPGYIIAQFDILREQRAQIEGQLEFTDNETLKELLCAAVQDKAPEIARQIGVGLMYGA